MVSLSAPRALVPAGTTTGSGTAADAVHGATANTQIGDRMRSWFTTVSLLSGGSKEPRYISAAVGVRDLGVSINADAAARPSLSSRQHRHRGLGYYAGESMSMKKPPEMP